MKNLKSLKSEKFVKLSVNECRFITGGTCEDTPAGTHTNSAGEEVTHKYDKKEGDVTTFDVLCDARSFSF